MARRRNTQPPPPAAAPQEDVSYPALSFGEQIHVAVTGRAERIKQARARTPTPTYEQIAVEVGCCVKTVYNVLKAADG